jgi:hypothetical protein
MKQMLRLILPIVAVGVLVVCSNANAGLIPSGQVDYQYFSPAPNGAWTEVVDPGFGAPSWITIPSFPFNLDKWIAVPNQTQPDMLKHFWFQVEWSTVPTTIPKPILWVPESSVVLVGSGETTEGNVSAWEWTIDPQPNSEVVQIPSSFPWNNVTRIDVASRCVPEPSTLVLAVVGGVVAFGAGRRWRRT